MSDYEIRKGCKYLIRTSDEEDTIGIFVEYVRLGDDSAMVFEMDDGKTRYIPVSQITYLDLLEKGDICRTKQDPGPYYG